MQSDSEVTGEFIEFEGERYYVIRGVDRMAPFFISVVSNVDHWLFVSSTGGLTAGRVSPETPLFPYVTDDKIHESSPHTGPMTIIRCADGRCWEPFNRSHDFRYSVSRNLYKNTLGNKLCFEEVNHDLGLAYRATWLTSDRYGFVRRSTLENLSEASRGVEVLDGLQNILPAGTPSFTQTNSSNLVDAYKWNELDSESRLAMFTLYSAITDRAEPSESLRANVVFSLGLDAPTVLLSSKQLDAFRGGDAVVSEDHTRGIRGAYLVHTRCELTAGGNAQWDLVADVELSQADVVALRAELEDPQQVSAAIDASIARGSDELARIMASGDGFQLTAEENVSVHHYANVLFNILRGGVFDDHYTVTSRDFCRTLEHFNREVFERHQAFRESLPEALSFGELFERVRATGDRQLERLCREYLPITFGRRHGDPSRPWNKFTIRLTDDEGNRLLSYEGNWRDIFQNWEALAFSFPDLVENMIAKFVNASTMDGYNPYRITKDGIDWEEEDPEDPWSYIGYWGDHQIIYLQKLLELSQHFHPSRLVEMLYEPVFSYASVPYRIKPFAAVVDDPKNTVLFDDAASEEINERVSELGADGKLVMDEQGAVYQVTLRETLLVPLLSKLGNLVVDGGIWMNTQRPEWNDANNALVGQGLSMVTLYYLRRYVRFLKTLTESELESVELSSELNEWLGETAQALARLRETLSADEFSASQRFEALTDLGEASSRYRESVYVLNGFSGRSSRKLSEIAALLDDALVAIERSVQTNRRDDDLYHAYNLLELHEQSAHVGTLYPMLEGQVAVLSGGALSAERAVRVVEALYASAVYREDQGSFMLYPDRELPSFLEKNRIPEEALNAIPLLSRMVGDGDSRIVLRDPEGVLRFNPDFANARDLEAVFEQSRDDYGALADGALAPTKALYERVFRHQEFTGRSGTMFGFEGLGSIYWHMVSKLLLAIQENFFAADGPARQQLAELYYRVREGIGFNKT
ncbi:MAG: hypothetical protein AAF658_04255, partial [Myxococcota bacterium]